MAEEHLELLERLAQAVNDAEIPDDLVAPDFLIENAVTAVTDKTYHGREGALQWRNDFFEVLGEGARYEQRVDKATPEFAVIRCRITGEGSASGAPFDFRWMAVVWFRDGRIARAAGFNSREEALRAVGLPT